ncbi:MAG TPA: ferritin-like domain-containing protein [Acidimicrobiales bacterium]|nr:ferritin-like domain-containing protein [Acidimicrobiales bacterium]
MSDPSLHRVITDSERPAEPSGAARLSRRRIFRDAGALALVIGGTAVAVAAIENSAGAASAPSDQDTAKFLESLELALVAIYGQALGSGKLTTPSNVALMTAYSGHHKAHAQALGPFAGDAATAQPNPGVLTSVGDQMREAPDETHMLGVVFEVENAIAATYLYAIGVVSGPQLLVQSAAILPVEAEHGAAAGQILGKDPANDPDMVPPFQTTIDEIMPSTYPPAS